MKYKKKSLMQLLTKVFSTLDNKNYNFLTINGTTSAPGVKQGIIERNIIRYQIYDSEKEISILDEKDILSEQRIYIYGNNNGYKDDKKVFPTRELEEEEIKNIISKKVIEYPYLSYFFDKLKETLDNNYEKYHVYELSDLDIYSLLAKTDNFKHDYDNIVRAADRPKKRTRNL